ncbi:UxaA family hydrolase [uncultured Succinatimonas sp.]|uniref:UxaA family hydrolase n=1 Tax=uncultured Succinatimonas sp. TaxID=1262973 RepID=UPI0025F87966|nr:altronate dehydratase family protein [uncultured Succinatimonas sp.]
MQAIKINPEDVVAVALTDLKQGQEVKLENDAVILKEDIPRGHKFALYDLAENDPVIKYGYPIGRAKHAVKKGEHVHTQNVKTDLKAFGSYSYDKAPKTELKHVDRYFDGYVRSNGDVGIRNEIWIIPTVFCVNHVAKELESYAQSRLSEFANVDDCLALTHPYGCSQMGEDQTTTQKILACLTRHPNAGAVLVLGLGCENNNIGVFKEFLDANDDRIHFLNSQDVEDELTAGKAIIDELLVKVNAYKREKVSINKLRIGLKCGGSDGLSGITANPLIGRLSDVVVGSGGTSVMTEVPEMFGAEQILMNRAVTPQVFDKCVNLINDFKHYFSSHGQVVSENPSPGNKAGGITTLEDKSLGCVQKGGKAEVCDVLKYGESLRTHGLNLLQGPGNDGVSCTALASAGCHMVLFSTGRGTPFATAIPTVKISTNTALFNKKQDWIDFNAGAIVDGESFDSLTDKLLDYVLAVASGKKTLSEKRGFHDIIIWKDGVTM